MCLTDEDIKKYATGQNDKEFEMTDQIRNMMTHIRECPSCNERVSNYVWEMMERGGYGR